MSWTRKELKQNGWGSVRKYYLQAFLVSLVTAAAAGDITLEQRIQGNWQEMQNAVLHTDPVVLVSIGAGGLSVGLISTLFRIFVGNPVMVGGCRFYVKSRNMQQGAGFESILEAFQEGRYTNLVITMFMRGLITVLFSFLLVIPGIIKMYEYRMVPYILSDEPYLPWRDALARSKYLMYGHKWEAFVLEISFLGWYILGALLFGLGIYFVNPYHDATMAEFYTALKQTTPDYDAYG